MEHKDNRVYVSHMQDCIARIDEYVESKEHFFNSRLVQDAVVRNLQVMAESSQRLSISIKEQYSQIPWKNISGFRNIIVHDYLGLDLEMIWSVVEIELPKLEKALNKMEIISQ